MEKELVNKLKYLIRKKKSFQEVCKELELSDIELYGIVNILKDQGELIDIVNGELIRIKKSVNTSIETFIRDNSSIIKFLMISDTHCCNKADRMDIIRYLFRKCAEENIKHVLHSGDLTDGYYPNRPQQVYELKAHGYDEQAQYVIDKWPSEEGIKTYFIQGNHDFTHIRNGGGEIGKRIAQAREDMVYLGADRADIKIGKLKIHLFHGAGGKAYSRMYKLQRYAETLDTKNLPHILGMGHHHTSGYMQYMGIHCFQNGALVGETQYSRQQGFKNEMTVWWVDVHVDVKGVPYSVVPRQETFTKKLIRKMK